MRIVLLGSTGQVGNIIYSTLCKEYPHDEIIGCVRKQSDLMLPPLMEKHTRKMFRPYEDDWKVFGKTDVLINCIGIIEETKEMRFEHAHTGLTHIILNNRELIGNPRIIQISILGADNDSPSRFSRSKAQADLDLLATYDTVVVRPSLVCTPGTMIVKKFKLLKKMSKLMLGVTMLPEKFIHTKLQPVMGEDVAEVVAKLCIMDNHPPIVNVAGPEIVELQELLKKYLEVKVKPIPDAIFDTTYKLISPIARNIINPDQIMMLSKDNTTDIRECEKILDRHLMSCDAFWKKELGEPEGDTLQPAQYHVR